jgi:hypothetical protein
VPFGNCFNNRPVCYGLNHGIWGLIMEILIREYRAYSYLMRKGLDQLKKQINVCEILLIVYLLTITCVIGFGFWVVFREEIRTAILTLQHFILG